MQIFWKGQSCFQIVVSKNRQEQVKVVIDPYDESIGLKVPSLQADIALFTHDHPDHNNIKAIEGTPFIIANPGEYEVQGIFIQGIASFHDKNQGKERGTNTIYVMEAEDLRVCHLGDFGQKELTSEQQEAMGEIDVLLIPVGGVYTIGAQEASALIHQIEPRIVIPMHYFIPKLKMKLAGLEEFLKIMGVRSIQPQEKLSVKAKDLQKEETQIVVLKP